MGTGLRMSIVAAGIAVSGCTVMTNERHDELAAQAVASDSWTRTHPRPDTVQKYRLHVGDVLDLRFPRVAELNETVTVRPDGRISLVWAGELQAAGRTPAQLSQAITEAYRGVLREPRVDVLVKTFQPPRVFVTGEVARPGEQTFLGDLTVLQAVVRSGDFTPDARRDSVVVIRQTGGPEPELIRVDLSTSMATRLSATAQPHCTGGQAGCGDAVPLQPEGFALEPLDVVVVPKTQLAGVAQLFERYINHIVPFYRNIGLTMIYTLGRDAVVIPATR